jgi:hypothetical protein
VEFTPVDAQPGCCPLIEKAGFGAGGGVGTAAVTLVGPIAYFTRV